MKRSLRERFESLYVPEPNTGCWLWTGSIKPAGYGQIEAGGRKTGTRRNALAHRLSYEMFVGPIPMGLDLDHLCRVRSCVNPAHLEPVTRSENCRRGNTGKNSPIRSRSITHCARGHPRGGANTYTSVDRRWYTHHTCKPCIRILLLRRKAPR